MNDFKAVLIDDDELVRMTWEFQAKKEKINFKAYQSFDDFLKQVDGLKWDCFIFVDFHLKSHLNGGEVTKQLSEKGFTNLFLVTGEDSLSIEEFPWLKGIRGKKPTFE